VAGGQVVYEPVAEAHGLPFTPLAEGTTPSPSCASTSWWGASRSTSSPRGWVSPCGRAPAGDIAGAMTDLPTLAVAAEEATRRRSRRWFVAVMSGSQAKGRWRISGRTTAVAVMGGVDMDLRHAEIDGPEIVITAVAFWGGIQITVPEGFDVELEGFSFMGGRDLKLRNVPRVPGSPRIRVRGFAIMGGIDVKSRPSRTGREIGQSIVDRVLGTVSALPGRPGPMVGTPGVGPIDLEALARDIKEQFRAQRDAGRTGVERGGRRDHPPSTGPRAEDRDPTPLPAGAPGRPGVSTGREPSPSSSATWSTTPA
jgi:hypothetical protein